MIKNKKTKKILIIVLSVALLLAAGGWYVFAYNKDRSAEGDTAINMDPPTEEEQEEADRVKDRIVEDRERSQNQQNSSGNDGQKTRVTPIFGYLSQTSNNVEANGYITTAIEEDGRCTLTLERQGQRVTETRRALPDAQSTVCGQIQISKNRLSSGEWNATITYSSAKHEGVSEVRKIGVE